MMGGSQASSQVESLQTSRWVLNSVKSFVFISLQFPQIRRTLNNECGVYKLVELRSIQLN